MLEYPLVPQLARLEERLPSGDGWVYEPKWDGFRCLLFKDGRSVRLQSRNGKDLSRSFSEVVRAAAGLPDCVLDGELVVCRDGRLEFEALLDRLAGQDGEAASLVVFDAVAWEGADLRELPFERRRSVAEALPQSPYLQLTPQTAEFDVATSWLHESFRLGFEGVVAKKLSLHYQCGERCLVKVKHLESLDVVVGGYTGTRGSPKGLIAGLYDADGVLHHVGTTSLLPGNARACAAGLPLSENPFGGLQPGRSRWPSHQFDEWVAVEPRMVCEIRFSRLDGMRFRHSVRFVRWRPDRDAADCTYQQLARFRPGSV
ncbi:MAG TPA: ATP-dependent DNA ligase [Actinomycetota bacterium]|nr:ATP-dependent DNA ligase [Actinomycetota bacterium]